MDGMPSGEVGLSLVRITVLPVTPAHSGKLFALASVEVDIDGVQIAIHGIRALRVETTGARIELPKFRGLKAEWQAAITLPEEVRGGLDPPRPPSSRPRRPRAHARWSSQPRAGAA